MGIDPDELSAQILERIGAWNALGRDLSGRFLGEAERARLDLAGREVRG